MRARASQVPSGYYRDNMGVVQVRPRHADMHAQEAVGNEMRWGGDPFGRVELPGLAHRKRADERCYAAGAVVDALIGNKEISPELEVRRDEAEMRFAEIFAEIVSA